MRKRPNIPNPLGRVPSPNPQFRQNPFGQPPAGRRETAPPEQYGNFQASLLFCPTCKQATPARERLLLVLPTGNLYEYLCSECGTSTGSKTEKEHQEIGVIKP